MEKTIRRADRFQGNPKIPGDKSISHRGLIFGALAHGRTEVLDILDSGDVNSTARCLRGLGVKITTEGNRTLVEGVGDRGFSPPADTLDCGNSGTTIRLLMGVLAGRGVTARLTGDGSLTRRPMKRVSEPLRQMGAQFELTNGDFAPLTVKGARLRGIDYQLKIASAQIKSAILLAALAADGVTTITGEIHSRDHTERMLRYFGAEVDATQAHVRLRGGQRLKAAPVHVPGDPSTAAFWMGAASVIPRSEIRMDNIALNATRIGFLKALERMGANIRIELTSELPEPVGRIHVTHGGLKGVHVTAQEVPSLIDELPLLAVLATQARGVTLVEGAEELRVKESDRIEAVATNLRAMGAVIETRPDGYRIEGPQKLKGARLETFHDHRIAMAFSIAGLVAEGDTVIRDAECASISYPAFYDTLERLDRRMTQAAVIGSPVAHSRSPAIFACLASRLGRADLSYSAVEVKAAGLGAWLEQVRAQPEFVGLNVTIPHKEPILRLLDEVAPEARAVGAVNVVHRQGKLLKGYNTDVFGILKTLEEQGCRVEGEDAWIWGAGGAARAVAYALGTLRARCVYLCNRDEARARKTADELGSLFERTSFLVAPASSAIEQPLRLLVNATPLGMKGALPAGNFFEALGKLPLTRGALAFDLIYNPERTPFLLQAESRGLHTVGGLDMLIYQALKTWETWFGPLEGRLIEAKTALARKLRERPVFLTGFMGVGKSVVGRIVASRLGWDFLDTDEWIQHQAGATVTELFERHGEARFRELERQAVSFAASRERTVVSLGGGAVVDPANLEEIERSGSLVCLEAGVEQLAARLSASAASRPLLAGLTDMSDEQRAEKIRVLLETRRPAYDRAQFKVATEGARPGETADRVLRLLFSDAGLRALGAEGART